MVAKQPEDLLRSSSWWLRSNRRTCFARHPDGCEATGGSASLVIL